MTYQGGVKSSETAEITGILFLNNRPYTISQGDVVGGIKIVGLEMNQLQIMWGDSLYTLLRN